MSLTQVRLLKLYLNTQELKFENKSYLPHTFRVSQLQTQLDILTGQLREETSSKESAIRRLVYMMDSLLKHINKNI